MNITRAIVFVDGTAIHSIDSECLVECDPQDSGGAIDRLKRALELAFQDIHGTNDVDVLLPELGEVLE